MKLIDTNSNKSFTFGYPLVIVSILPKERNSFKKLKGTELKLHYF